MRLILAVSVLAIPLFLSACTNVASTETAEEKSKTKVKTSLKEESNIPVAVNPAAVLKDFLSWYSYHYKNIHLGRDFIGLTADSIEVNKADMLTMLATGRFVVFKTHIRNNIPVYQLYQLDNSNADIQKTIKNQATTELLHHQMEGKELPEYSFADLDGKIYNATTTKGKFLVIKCWFIRCAACVKEFPVLNELEAKYNNRNEILFISLAMDTKDDLKQFLVKKPFNYAVVPNMEKYMSEQLKIALYPTHILVDKNRKILKVVGNVDDLIPAIEKELSSK